MVFYKGCDGKFFLKIYKLLLIDTILMAEDWKKRIVLNPKVMVGKPVIKGTRLTIDFILELLAHGWTNQKVLKNYPQLKNEDISAVLKY